MGGLEEESGRSVSRFTKTTMIAATYQSTFTVGPGVVRPETLPTFIICKSGTGRKLPGVYFLRQRIASEVKHP